MIENIVENCYNVHIAVSTANIDAKELGIMRFTIRGKNIEVTEGLRSAVTEKLGKLEKYFTEIKQCQEPAYTPEKQWQVSDSSRKKDRCRGSEATDLSSPDGSRN